MRYFVTGATGFIGGKLAERLIGDAHQVVAVARTPAKAQHLADLGARLHQGDITDKESMRAAMTGADGVFHLAAWYKVGAKSSRHAHRINVDGTRNVLELAHELEVPKSVYTSTLAVFSDTGGRVVDESYRHDPADGFLSEYDRTKHLAHYQVALPLIEKGLPLVIVLPGLVYGPGDTSAMGNALRSYLQGKLPLLPKGTAFAWAHVDDIVEGHVLAMEKGSPGESYIIAGPVHTMIDAFELAEHITGVPAPRLRAAPLMLKGMAAVTGVLDRFIDLPTDYHPETLRVTAGVTYTASNAKARRDLGYRPRSLDDGLRETLEHEMKLLAVGGRAATD